MQTPRVNTLTRGSENYRQAYKNIIEIMVEMEISVELSFVSRAIKYDSLGLACYYGKYEAMQAILNISDSSGMSVLKTLSILSGIDAALIGIDCGFSEAIDTIVPRIMARLDVTNYNLLRAGRGPELLSYIDPWGATAFDLAMEYGYLDLAQFLLDKGATYDVYRLKGDHTIDDGEQSTLASVLPRMKPIRFLMELTPKPRLIVTNTGLNVFHILASDESLVMTTVGRAEFFDTLAYFHRMDPSLIHARGGSQGLTPFHLVASITPKSWALFSTSTELR
ncbi:hypothetical protein NXS19_011282 [Fusarium pseudograminearum]|nr:hypothetical protein NXS19_011282 [Fusarium pseudograminearum]